MFFLAFYLAYNLFWHSIWYSFRHSFLAYILTFSLTGARAWGPILSWRHPLRPSPGEWKTEQPKSREAKANIDHLVVFIVVLYGFIVDEAKKNRSNKNQRSKKQKSRKAEKPKQRAQRQKKAEKQHSREKGVIPEKSPNFSWLAHISFTAKNEVLNYDDRPNPINVHYSLNTCFCQLWPTLYPLISQWNVCVYRKNYRMIYTIIHV